LKIRGPFESSERIPEDTLANEAISIAKQEFCKNKSEDPSCFVPKAKEILRWRYMSPICK
jgi:hypothetical protein